jgi:hypothetical protein
MSFKAEAARRAELNRQIALEFPKTISVDLSDSIDVKVHLTEDGMRELVNSDASIIPIVVDKRRDDLKVTVYYPWEVSCYVDGVKFFCLCGELPEWAEPPKGDTP